MLLADEPTGDLERQAADAVMAVLGQIHHRTANTVILVTYDEEMASRAADRIVRLRDGRLMDGG